MSEGTPKAIEMKGIVRNATKIGVQDGQAEDLINLRFVDGSWRASGNGRQIVNMPTGTIYQQLYVHTNVYHHLLGVDNGTLYWFAEIDNDGVTFYPLDGTTDRSQWPEDKQGLPTERKALTTVVGDVWITQTGHLLTVIDESDDFEHFVFKTSTKEYIEVNMDVNGKQTDRSLYPFGQVYFNLISDVNNSDLVNQKQIDDLDLKDFKYWDDIHDYNEGNLKSAGFIDNSSEDKTVTKFYHNIMVDLFSEATKKNQFTRPLLVVSACKLYDGSYVYTSNPVLLFPRQIPSSQKGYVKSLMRNNTSDPIPDPQTIDVQNSEVCTLFENAYAFRRDNYVTPEDFVAYDPFVYGKNKEHTSGSSNSACFLTAETNIYPNFIPTEQEGILQKGGGEIHHIKDEHVPVYCNGVAGIAWDNLSVPGIGLGKVGGYKYRAAVIGSQLSLSVKDIDFIYRNNDIIQSLCIFVTKQADLWPMEADNDDGKICLHLRTLQDSGTNEGDICAGSVMVISYAPKMYTSDKVIYELMTSPFYLLREYNKNNINELLSNPIVDIYSAEYEGLLEADNIVQQKTLPTEALSRTTYLPKVSYMYNGRLHIADYKSHPFFGYPIDLFHLHNHSVKVQDGAWFPADADGQRVLPNLTGNSDEYLQYPKEQVTIKDAVTMGDSGALINAAAPYFLVKVYIDTAQGEQIVTRYIPAYDTSTQENGRADFIEDLNPLLTYPDVRAKKMEIYFVDHYISSPAIERGYYLKRKEFTLKPHPYLNMAYYIDPELKPIKLSDFDNWPVTQPIQ